MKKKKFQPIHNKQSSYAYTFLARYVAGIILKGTETKAIIEKSKVNLNDSYCFFQGKKLFVKNMYIGPYKNAQGANHEPRRNKELLLQEKELNKLRKAKQNQGLTIVPTSLFISETGYFKLGLLRTRLWLGIPHC